MLQGNSPHQNFILYDTLAIYILIFLYDFITLLKANMYIENDKNLNLKGK